MSPCALARPERLQEGVSVRVRRGGSTPRRSSLLDVDGTGWLRSRTPPSPCLPPRLGDRNREERWMPPRARKSSSVGGAQTVRRTRTRGRGAMSGLESWDTKRRHEEEGWREGRPAQRDSGRGSESPTVSHPRIQGSLLRTATRGATRGRPGRTVPPKDSRSRSLREHVIDGEGHATWEGAARDGKKGSVWWVVLPGP